MSEPTPSSAAVPVVDEQHPWLGLLPFTEKTRRFFFGRETEIGEILDRIRENTLTVLFGQSGLGKTSLLGAGVVPRLEEAGYAAVLLRLDLHSGGVPAAGADPHRLRPGPAGWRLARGCSRPQALGSVASPAGLGPPRLTASGTTRRSCTNTVTSMIGAAASRELI